MTRSPAKRHQRVTGDLYMILRPHVDQQRVGDVVFSPSTVRLTADSRLEPDIFVIPAGVPHYWIVDGEACLFEIWHPGNDRPLIVDGAFDWQPDGARETLPVDVARLFASVADGAPLSGDQDER